MPIFGKKTFKIILQDREDVKAESWYKASGTQDLPSFLKLWPWVDIWPSYGNVLFTFLCVSMGKILKIQFLKMY